MTIPAVRPPELIEPGVINCAAYAGGCRVADLSIDKISDALRQDDRFVWIGLYEPSADVLARVQRQFGLHDLAVEDAHTAHQRPKFEQYDNSLFVVLRTAQLAPGQTDLEFGETHVFVGPRYVVTVRHGSLQSHVGLRARCEATPQLLVKGPGYVLYALMDFIVDQYFPIAARLEDDLEAIEDEIFSERPGRAATARIYALKRDLLRLKRAVSPLVDVCNRLVRFEHDLIPADTRPYFRDVYDHVVRINEMIDTQRELLTMALEANLSLISSEQSEHTKRLAAWAAIIAVPTAIAGIWGMNFDAMPELRWRYGYALALATIIGSSGALYAGFKRSGWL
jgi:magnesium transporter